MKTIRKRKLLENVKRRFLRRRFVKNMPIRTISEKRTDLPQPDAILIIFKGNYQHALECYFEAQSWILETGQSERKDIFGVINRPSHPHSPSESKTCPADLLDDPEWSLSVDIFCADKSALDWVKSLDIPNNSALQIYGEV